MFVAEGLEFCLEGRQCDSQQLELMLAERLWRDRRGLPEYLLVTRWNAFGRLGRTLVSQFFVPVDAESSFAVRQATPDACRLRPLIDLWAADLDAQTWGRFEDLYVDEPALCVAEGRVLLFSSEDHGDRGVPQVSATTFPLEIKRSPFVSVADFRSRVLFDSPGTYVWPDLRVAKE